MNPIVTRENKPGHRDLERKGHRPVADLRQGDHRLR